MRRPWTKLQTPWVAKLEKIGFHATRTTALQRLGTRKIATPAKGPANLTIALTMQATTLNVPIVNPHVVARFRKNVEYPSPKAKSAERSKPETSAHRTP